MQNETAGVKIRALNVRDFCAAYRIGRSTAFNEIASGSLKSALVCGKRLIRVEDAEAWFTAKFREQNKAAR